jgi:integrase
VLKSNGYNLEHNFGHGKQTLASVFLTLNLLAFAFRTAAHLAMLAWREAVAACGATYRFFENLRTITAYLVFAHWPHLLRLLAALNGSSFLVAEDVERVIASCSADATGLRDKAVLLLLARLGLRAGEVAQLRFADIDWGRRQLTLRGKGRRPERLPLPQEVGAALLRYLRRSRQPLQTPEVFTSVVAPLRPLTRAAHVLRHSPPPPCSARARLCLASAWFCAIALRGRRLIREGGLRPPIGDRPAVAMVPSC